MPCFLHTMPFFNSNSSPYTTILQIYITQLNMCRQYIIVYSCGHVANDARICSLSIYCNNLSRNNIIPIPSHCPDCISAPTFPTPEEQIFISIPDLDGLVEAGYTWTRFHRLFFGEPITDSSRSPNEDAHAQLLSTLTEQDLNQFHYWLKLLQESRRNPDSWDQPRTGLIDNSDKIIMLIIIRVIVFNEIEAKEATIHGLDDITKPNLLTKVKIEDLEEDRRECIICTEEYGHTLEADEEPEFPVKLPCGHSFGEFCIRTAFEQLGWKCPYCRAPFNREEFGLNPLPKKIVSPWWMKRLIRPAE